MIIKKLELINYRNYNKLLINLNDNINIFIGNNAQGKTNILESIYMLSLSKSFLTKNDKNLIKFEKKFSKIKGLVIIENYEKLLEVFLTDNNKKLLINKKEIKKNSDFVLNLKVITFGPNDLKIIKDNPSIRRRYLNIALSQLNSKYFKLISDFNIILKTRNEYLKKIKNDNYNKEYFDILTEKYVDISTNIYKIRSDYLNEINKYISEKYKKITDDDGLKIKYISIYNNFDMNNYNNDLMQKLKINFNKEVLYGNTLFGIHRDDFSFCLNDKDLIQYGSQGQQRSAVLALKLTELEIFKIKNDDSPILLLDDLFSELDIEKQNNIVKNIDKNIQTIITTTDLKKINNKLIRNSKIFKIIDGRVDEINGK